MDLNLDDAIESASEGWFESNSGWCWFDQNQQLIAVHPPSRWNHRFRGPLAAEIRNRLSSAEKPTDSSLIKTMEKFEIPGLKPMLTALEENNPQRIDRNQNIDFLSLDSPRQLWIEVQGSCNEQCIHCYANSAPVDLPSLSPETVSRVIDDAAKMGIEFIQFTGGDPLLWDELPRAVHQAQQAGITVEIYTNGVKLDDDLYTELIREEPPRFAFSVYSHDPETHNRITQLPGSWKRTREGIRRAVDGPTRVRVGVIIMGENSGHEEQTRAMLEDWGVPSENIRISYVQNVGRGETTEGASEESSEPSTKSESTPSNQGQAEHSIGKTNTFNQGKLCVSYDGNIIPCIFQRWMRLGSIHERSLSEIVRNPELEQLSQLNKSDDGDKQRLACGDCRFHYFLLKYQLKKLQSQDSVQV